MNAKRRGGEEAKRRILRGLIAGVGLLLLAHFVYAAGGVFTTTAHGNPTTGVQRLTGTDYPRGTCVQCHYQHASVEGSSTGTANPYALFAPDDNNLCGTSGCHDTTGADHIYLGLSPYNASVHGTNAAVVWPGPTPWARRTSDADKCINCHDPHGYADSNGMIPTLGLARTGDLCLTCHDGSPAHTDIKSELMKPYSHPVTFGTSNATYAGRHSATEAGDPSKFGSANRHSECEDCHNVHDLQSLTTTPTAPTASPRLLGTSYISVLNGAAWTPPTYTYHAPDDPTPIQYEYQLCFKCHSSWTTLPLTGPSGRTPTDKALEFNPNNPSYHPVEEAAKNTLPWPTNSLNPPFTASSLIYCSDCHGSDSPTDPNGPHGSNYRYLLKYNYRTDEPTTANLDSDYKLCFHCHNETALLDTTKGDTQNTNFPYHDVHLTSTGTSYATFPTCNSCHGNIHGSNQERLIDFSQEEATGHITTPSFSWTSNGDGTGYCTGTCHGYNHDSTNSAY